MKSAQFSRLLLASHQLVEGRTAELDGIDQLVAALANLSTPTIKTISERLMSSADTIRVPQRLVNYLTLLGSFLTLAGAAKAASDCRMLEEALKLAPPGSAEDFGQSIKFLQPKPRSKKEKRPIGGDANLYLSYAGKLTGALSDPAAFATVLAEMKSDKKLKIAGLKEISKHFLGYERPYSNISEIFDALDSRRVEENIQGGAFRALKQTAA